MRLVFFNKIEQWIVMYLYKQVYKLRWDLQIFDGQL